MKAVGLCCLGILILTACHKYEFAFTGATLEEIITSREVGDDFRIQVFTPEGYRADQEYPVLFLLDGDWYFQDLSRELDDLIKTGTIEPAILVGVGYPSQADSRRFRDYTFPFDPDYGIENGAGDQFQRFLARELIPFVESNFSPDTSRYTLMGHSLGGLYTVFQCFQDTPNPFSSYVAVSPSLWWSNGYIFGLEAQSVPDQNQPVPRIYLGVGGDEPPSMTILAEELTERLRKRDRLDQRLHSQSFKGASHSQTPLIGFTSGIKFILN